MSLLLTRLDRRSCTSIALAACTLAIALAIFAWPAPARGQDCRLDGSPETCGRPDPPVETQCYTQCCGDWDCLQQLRAERAQRREAKRQKKLYEQSLREWKARNAIQERANALVMKGAAASEAGDAQLEMKYYRAALRLSPTTPEYRLNVMSWLAYHNHKWVWDAIRRRDYSRLAEFRAALREIEQLNGGDMASIANYRTVMANLDALRSAFALLESDAAYAEQARRIAAREQALAKERERAARIAAKEARKAERIAPRAAPGSGQEVIQINKGARSAEAAAIANDPGREGTLPGLSAIGELERATDGATKTDRVFDGGGGRPDTISAPPGPASDVSGERVISARDLERYNRSPEFRVANAKLEQAAAAHNAIEAKRSELARQQQLAKSGLAAEPSRAEIAEATARAAQAKSVREAAASARNKVIERIEYGEPIVVD